MTKSALVELIAVLCGCTANQLRPALPQLVPNRQRVVDRNDWPDIKDAPLQYREISNEPVSGPYYILISDQGEYCIVDAVTYTRVPDGELWDCGWRVLRPA